MAEKEATVFVIDIGKSTRIKNQGREASDLDWSLQWLWDRVTHIVSLGRKTLVVGVVALGSDTTNTNMSDDDESYKHIDIVQPMQPMQMPQLRALKPLLKSSGTDQRDAMSAIIIAIDMIMRHCRHLQFKKRIYLVTNGTGAMDPDDTDTIVEQIQQNNIELTVLGVDFDDAEYGFKEEDKSHTKAKNEKLLKNLVDQAGGTYGTMQEAIESLAIPNIKPVRPTPTYKGQLRLGDPANYDTAITIDVERYFKVSIRRPPTASSVVQRPDSSEGGEGFASVQTSRVYTIPDSTAPNNEKTIEREELARGFQYGRTAVPISESDENITKLETEVGYEIIGFIPMENVERYMILDNSNMIVAQKGNDKAAFALSSLVHALFEIATCAIARFVKKDMAEPCVTLLSPYADEEVECLIENMLPFAEDIRQYRFPPLDKILTVSGKHLESHRNLPDKNLMKAMSDFVDEFCFEEQHQKNMIEDTFSPLLHSIEGAIRHRAVHREGTLPTVGERFMAISMQSEEMQNRSKSSLQDLIEAADVKKVPPKAKGRKRYRETEKPLSGLNVADLFRKKNRTQISTNNAIPEFKQLVETTDDMESVYDAVKQMFKIIEDQVTTSFGDSNYERVIEELFIVRHEMSELEEFDIWHKSIRDLKQRILSEKLGGNRQELWWRIRLNKLGLIDDTQDPNSDITKADADAFLSSK